MPLYVFFCNDDKHHDGCGHEWEAIHPIEERAKPLGEPCPKCKKKGNVCRKLDPITQVDPMLVMGHKRVPQEFKDKLEAIKKQNPNMKSDWI